MRTISTILFLFCFIANLCSQRMELPTADALKKNKITKLELYIGDTLRLPTTIYRYDSEGRIIYEKTRWSPDVKPYYTVYKYDKQNRKSEIVDRFDDGSFKQRTLITYRKDSLRTEKYYNNPADTSWLHMEYLLTPSNVVLSAIFYAKNGKHESEMRGILDKTGKAIGNYDSSAQTRTARECIYFKHQDIRRYDSTGKLISIVRVTFNDKGMIMLITDTVPHRKNAMHYMIDRRDGMDVLLEGKPMTTEQRSNFDSRFSYLHLNEAYTPAVPSPPAPNCYTHQPVYDATGLIISDTIGNSCYPSDLYPYLVYYWYSH